jgi:hypothetical protein
MYSTTLARPRRGEAATVPQVSGARRRRRAAAQRTSMPEAVFVNLFVDLRTRRRSHPPLRQAHLLLLPAAAAAVEKRVQRRRRPRVGLLGGIWGCLLVERQRCRTQHGK